MSSYESHSFRIGAASLAAENGMSDAQIRGLSRWKSDGFKLKLQLFRERLSNKTVRDNAERYYG